MEHISRFNFEGQFMDGCTAAIHEVMVRVTSTDLVFIDRAVQQELGRWHLKTIRLDTAQEGVLHVHTTLAPNAILTVKDPGFQDAIHQISGGALVGKRRNRRLVAWSLVVATILVVAGIYGSLDIIASTIAQRIPVKWEKKLGDKFATYLLKDTCKENEALASLEIMKRRLLAGKKNKFHIRLHISRSKIPNAFAMPGGGIVIHKGLIDAADGPDEVAGIMAHEMQHVLRRHAMASLVRSSILTVMWQVALGDFSGFLIVDPETAAKLVSLRYDRAMENEADRGAMRMLDRAHISRSGFANFFERYANKGSLSIPEFLSTHPSSISRATTIRSGMSKANLRPALTAKQWGALRSACGTSAPDPETAKD